jgi:hypothetical protein
LISCSSIFDRLALKNKLGIRLYLIHNKYLLYNRNAELNQGCVRLHVTFGCYMEWLT